MVRFSASLKTPTLLVLCLFAGRVLLDAARADIGQRAYAPGVDFEVKLPRGTERAGTFTP